MKEDQGTLGGSGCDHSLFYGDGIMGMDTFNLYTWHLRSSLYVNLTSVNLGMNSKILKIAYQKTKPEHDTLPSYSFYSTEFSLFLLYLQL